MLHIGLLVARSRVYRCHRFQGNIYPLTSTLQLLSNICRISVIILGNATALLSTPPQIAYRAKKCMIGVGGGLRWGGERDNRPDKINFFVSSTVLQKK